MNVEELVADALEHIEGSSAALQAGRIVRHTWPDLDEVVTQLAVAGLGAYIGQELHRERVAADEAPSEVEELDEAAARRVSQPRRLAQPDSRLWKMLYEDADGKQQPFMRFTIADLRALAETCRGRAAGYVKTARRAEKAEAALQEYGVEYVYELPDELIAELEEM